MLFDNENPLIRIVHFLRFAFLGLFQARIFFLKAFFETRPQLIGIVISAFVGTLFTVLLMTGITQNFSSKENLRRQALVYALAHLVPMDEIVERHPPVAGADKQSQADCLGAVIFDLAAAVAHARFEPYARTITHGILGPDTEQKRLLLKGFDRLETSFVGFLGAMGIVLDETRLRFFSYYLWSNILYLSASQDMIRVDLKTDAVPPEFMDAFCREIARMGCFSIGLPEPTLSVA